MKKNTTKRSLALSILSLVLCVAMLLGTTFAWFTDSVTSGVNKIVAGNLDIELYHTNKAVTKEKVTETTQLFKDVTLWEPGAVAYETLTVANVGTLALNYQMSILVDNEVKEDGHGLSEVLKVGTISGGLESGATRESIIGQISNWSSLASFTKNGSLNANTEDTPVTYVIYWQPGDNDNLYNMNNAKQGKTLSIDLGVSLIAGQKAQEVDSFDDQYDLSAFTAVTPATFNSVIANLKGGEQLYLGAGTYAPTANGTLKILVNDVTIVGAGKDVTVIDCGTTNVSEQAGLYIAGDNITIANLTIKSESDIGNVAPIKVTGYMAGDAGKVYKNFKLDNVAIEGNKGHGLNLHGVDGAIINNVDIRSYGKCGISCAKATNVTITNTKIAAGGWGEDLGCMYSATEGNVYNSPSSVTFGAGNEFGNGFVKTERPSTATGGTDVISGLSSPWVKTTAENGTYNYQMAVAQIGSNYYTTFQDALNAAQENDTIKLLTKELTVAKYVGKDAANPYGKYTEISANQGTVGVAMTGDKLANVVLRRTGASAGNFSTALTIEGYSDTEYTEFGSLDFSGSSNITVKYLKFNSANAIKAAQVYENGTTIKYKDNIFANIIDCNYRGTGASKPAGDISNCAAHDITIENCLFTGEGSAKHASLLIGGQTGGGAHPTDWTINNCTFETKHIYGYLMMEYMSKGELKIINNIFGSADSEGHYNMMTGSCTENFHTTITGNTYNLNVNDATGELMSLGGTGGTGATVAYTVENNTFNTYGVASTGFKIKNVNEYCYINDIQAVAANEEAIATSLSSNTGLASGTEIGGISYFGKK